MWLGYYHDHHHDHDEGQLHVELVHIDFLEDFLHKIADFIYIMLNLIFSLSFSAFYPCPSLQYLQHLTEKTGKRFESSKIYVIFIGISM